MGPTSNNFHWLAKSFLELISNCQLGPASYAYPLPLPFQGIKVNEEDITHAPNGVSRWRRGYSTRTASLGLSFAASRAG